MYNEQVTNTMLRKLNVAQRRVLNVVQQKKQISRTDLASVCDMNLSMVSRATKQLIDAGFIIETVFGKSLGGRRPIMLEINERYGYVIGLDFECTNIAVGIFDFSNRCIFFKHNIIKHKRYLEGLYDSLDEAMNIIEEQFGKKPLCISIAVHGRLDENTGTIKRSISFGWTDIHLRDIVMKRYEIPVYLTLNMQLAAYAEWKTTYKKQGFDSLVAFVISDGVGAGAILNGSIIHGKGAAGEIGLTFVGLKNNQERFLTLEELAGGQYLTSSAREQWDDPSNVWLRERTHNSSEDVYIEDVLAGILAGDAFSCRLFEDMIPYIGMGIVGLIRSYDPGLIVLTGLFSVLGNRLLLPVKAWLKKNLLDEDFNNIKIEVSTLHYNTCVSGAAYIAFEHLFGDDAALEAETAISSAAARSDDQARQMFKVEV